MRIITTAQKQQLLQLCVMQLSARYLAMVFVNRSQLLLFCIVSNNRVEAAKSVQVSA